MKFDRSKPPAYTQSISVWPDGAVLLFAVPLVEFIVRISLVESLGKGFCTRSGCLCFILLVKFEWSSAEWRFLNKAAVIFFWFASRFLGTRGLSFTQCCKSGGTARESQIYTGIKRVEVKPESPVLLSWTQCPFAFSLPSTEKKDPYTHHHIAFLPPHYSSLNASCFTISMGNGFEKFTTALLSPREERNPVRCWVSLPALRALPFPRECA